MIDKELCRKIIDYRAEHNLSQKKLALMCRVSLQTLCNIEKGIQSPSNLTRLKILKVIEKEN